MFTDFFYTLRERKVPVSVTEWMTLMEALHQGCISDLDEFYFLARAILVKSETHFDQYDVAFQQYFNGLPGALAIQDQFMEWLKDPAKTKELTEAERAELKAMDFDTLLKTLEERLKEQKEQHDGGSKWIGRGGKSPFGHSGTHPAGIRIGGDGGGGHAIQIASQRKFRNYRSDLILDVRQIKLALKGLRQLNRLGPEDELELEGTIKQTARNAGELELKWQRQRKNASKILLLMDAGGSMDPYARLCSLLFSAAKTSNHFKDLQYYYFHNCVYDNVYKDMSLQKTVATDYLMKSLDPEYKVVLVGDAYMAPSELTEKNGAIYYFENNQVPGITRLRRISEHFTHCVWLNPTDPRSWGTPSGLAISKLFPMFPLTLDGLGQAVKKLAVKR